jgi:hypothetical protein
MIIVIHQTVNFSVAANGGAGGYVYTWLGLPPGCTTANVPSLACVPTVAGAYNISVTVTDSNGYSVTSAQTVFVVAIEEATITLSIAGTPGNAVNLTVSDNGIPMAWGIDVRTPGHPNTLILLGIMIQVGHTYNMVLSYLPGYGGGKGTGANPANLTVSFFGMTNGTVYYHHTFNTHQPSTYHWVVSLNNAFFANEQRNPEGNHVDLLSMGWSGRSNLLDVELRW